MSTLVTLKCQARNNFEFMLARRISPPTTLGIPKPGEAKRSPPNNKKYKARRSPRIPEIKLFTTVTPVSQVPSVRRSHRFKNSRVRVTCHVKRASRTAHGSGGYSHGGTPAPIAFRARWSGVARTSTSTRPASNREGPAGPSRSLEPQS